MEDAPALTVDWDSGEGGLRLGGQLADAPARLRYDVLCDWQDQIELLVRQAEADLYPQRRLDTLRSQRLQNRRRRQLCERLGGQTIAQAEPLTNGDVLLHLRGAPAVVLHARAEDVKMETIHDAAHARRLAAADGHGDYYLREDEP